MPAASAVLHALTERALDWLAPPACVACDRPVARAGLCPACDELVRPPPGALRLDGVPVLAHAVYAAPIAVAVRRFKYGGRADFACGLARLLEPASAALDVRRTDVVVPVPLHPKRLAERGYNQAALLARVIAARWRAVYAPRALLRRYHTPHQASLPRADRLTNVASAFVVRRPHATSGRRVILVDDVVTTGATAVACIRALVEAGAEPCAVVAVARVTDAADEPA